MQGWKEIYVDGLTDNEIDFIAHVIVFIWQAWVKIIFLRVRVSPGSQTEKGFYRISSFKKRIVLQAVKHYSYIPR
jgi:hypothetical protein